MKQTTRVHYHYKSYILIIIGPLKPVPLYNGYKYYITFIYLKHKSDVQIFIWRFIKLMKITCNYDIKKALIMV